MFTVVIPLYNKELSVKSTIQSILNQTFKDFEIVIVNDGSTDNSLKVVQEINDTRIRIIDKPNGGVSSARNRGIQEAKYEWIAFSDADDIWEENHLQTILEMMNIYPNYNIYATSFRYSNNKKINKYNLTDDIYIIKKYFKAVLEEYIIWTGIVVINKKILLDVGLFNTKLSRGEDLDLWERLGKIHQIVKSNKITAIYRLEAENRSVFNINLEKSRIYHYDFSTARSNEEILYYKKFVIHALRRFIKRKDLKSFYKLKRKHTFYISYLDILKFKK